MEELAVARDIAILVLGNGEEGGPFAQVVEVEIDVVILGEGIEIGEVHVEQVSRTKRTQRSHRLEGLGGEG